MKALSHLGKAALVLMFTLIVTACGITEKVSEDEKDSTQTVKEESTAKDDEKTNEKMNYYVDCINSFSESVFRSRENYLRNVEAESGPTGQESYIGVSNLYQAPTTCVDSIKTANAINVENQLNGPATVFGESLTALAPLMEEANKYYEQENYKDDGFAKGKEMHGPLMAAFAAFEVADTALRDEMDVIQKKLAERSLKELEASGDQLSYLHTKLMIDAQALVDLADVPTYNDVDLDAFTVVVENYENTLNDLNAYEEANKAEVDDITTYSLFDSATEDFLVDAKQLMRRKRDNTPYDTGENALGGDGSELVDGSPASVVNAYNTLITRSNFMQY